MSTLTSGEAAFLRSVAAGFNSSEMAVVYNNIHKREYLEMLAMAYKIKEKREKDRTGQGENTGVGPLHVDVRQGAGGVPKITASTAIDTGTFCQALDTG